MKTRQRLWWAFGGSFLLLCVSFVGAAYRFEWSATGFLNKSLWDWLQLLIVPLALAIIALVFQLANTRTERQIMQQRYEQDQQITLEKQHEDLLQAYLDRISELLLKESLRTSSSSEEVRNVARVRTITALTQLNARRIGYVFTFLRGAGLMSTASTSSVVSLKDADLRAVEWGKANVSGVDLREADLREANLSGANLRKADLSKADLREADLSDADLSGAVLSGADLREADLSGTVVAEGELKETKLLKGATMPDGSTHAE